MSEVGCSYNATILVNQKRLMAVYGRDMLWEGKGTIKSCIADGNVLYKTNGILMQQDA
jgi:hypothetical protein